MCGILWQTVVFCGSLWQTVADCDSFKFYKLTISISLSGVGARADRTLPTILSYPSLESLEFLENLRLLKFEDVVQ